MEETQGNYNLTVSTTQKEVKWTVKYSSVPSRVDIKWYDKYGGLIRTYGTEKYSIEEDNASQQTSLTIHDVSGCCMDGTYELSIDNGHVTKSLKFQLIYKGSIRAE